MRSARSPTGDSCCVVVVVAEPFRHTFRVRYAEADAQGVLFNAHYLAYVDHTITELWRAAFGGYEQMLERGVDIVVAEARVRFRAAARFDDEVTVELSIVHLGTTSLATEYRFLRDDQLLAEVEMRHVFVTVGTAEKTPIPAWAREGLAPWTTVPASAGATGD
jgi:acyl-CoA thioester hydrolase